jgi:hypothetical protein
MYSSTLSLSSALEKGGCSTLQPGRFTPGNDPVPIVQESGWAPGPVWTDAKSLPPFPGFDPRTFQLVASIYICVCVCVCVHIKVTVGEVTKAQMWSRCIAVLSLSSALEGVSVQSHNPVALPPGMSRYPLYRRLGGPQDRSGRVQKISPPYRDSIPGLSSS